MSVYNTTLSILGDIAVYLLLGLLAWKLEVGSKEMLGIDPSARHAVNSDIIQEQ